MVIPYSNITQVVIYSDTLEPYLIINNYMAIYHLSQFHNYHTSKQIKLSATVDERDIRMSLVM